MTGRKAKLCVYYVSNCPSNYGCYANRPDLTSTRLITVITKVQNVKISIENMKLHTLVICFDRLRFKE